MYHPLMTMALTLLVGVLSQDGQNYSTSTPRLSLIHDDNTSYEGGTL